MFSTQSKRSFVSNNWAGMTSSTEKRDAQDKEAWCFLIETFSATRHREDKWVSEGVILYFDKTRSDWTGQVKLTGVAWKIEVHVISFGSFRSSGTGNPLADFSCDSLQKRYRIRVPHWSVSGLVEIDLAWSVDLSSDSSVSAANKEKWRTGISNSVKHWESCCPDLHEVIGVVVSHTLPLACTTYRGFRCAPVLAVS